MKTIFVKPAEVKRSWFLIDGEGKSLGRIAAKAAAIVRGKEKAVYAPHQEVGDFVVGINADKVKLTGDKAEQKLYRHHPGFPGCLKEVNYARLAEKHPTEPLSHAVHGMLHKGPLGHKLFSNVKIYAGAEHPHAAQGPQKIEI